MIWQTMLLLYIRKQVIKFNDAISVIVSTDVWDGAYQKGEGKTVRVFCSALEIRWKIKLFLKVKWKMSRVREWRMVRFNLPLLIKHVAWTASARNFIHIFFCSVFWAKMQLFHIQNRGDLSHFSTYSALFPNTDSQRQNLVHDIRNMEVVFEYL
jgi:hypothetical protein